MKKFLSRFVPPFLVVLVLISLISKLVYADNILVSSNNDFETSTCNDLNNGQNLEFHGYLKPLNYEESKDWRTLFFINVISEEGEPHFFAQEVIVSDGVLGSTIGAKEYEIQKCEGKHLVAEDDIYTFTLSSEGMFVDDRDGQRAELVFESLDL